MQMTLLQCDLTRLPTDATEEMFAPYLMAPQFHLGEIAIALQWVSRSLADSVIGGATKLGLAGLKPCRPIPVPKRHGSAGSIRSNLASVAWADGRSDFAMSGGRKIPRPCRCQRLMWRWAAITTA